METPFWVQRDGRHFFVLGGELDMRGSGELLDAFRDVETGPLTIDVGQLRFIDSTGIHALLELQQGLDPPCLILHGLHGQVARIFEVAGLPTLRGVHVIPCDLGSSEAARNEESRSRRP